MLGTSMPQPASSHSEEPQGGEERGWQLQETSHRPPIPRKSSRLTKLTGCLYGLLVRGLGVLGQQQQDGDPCPWK